LLFIHSNCWQPLLIQCVSMDRRTRSPRNLAYLGLLDPEDEGTMTFRNRAQWPRGLRRGSAVASLLGLRVRIPPGAWMHVSHKCCVLSGRGLCDGLITRPEESYWVWCVWVWSWSIDNEEARAHWGLLRRGVNDHSKRH
jgi:hypothetical protein